MAAFVGIIFTLGMRRLAVLPWCLTPPKHALHHWGGKEAVDSLMAEGDEQFVFPRLLQVLQEILWIWLRDTGSHEAGGVAVPDCSQTPHLVIGHS